MRKIFLVALVLLGACNARQDAQDAVDTDNRLGGCSEKWLSHRVSEMGGDILISDDYVHDFAAEYRANCPAIK